jgi:signal transduction histidine kinase
VVLTAGLVAEAWLGSAVAADRVPATVLGVVVTLAVGVRRRLPATTGLLAGGVAVVLAAVWSAPSLITWGIAWLCCMYALAVWAAPRRFAVVAALVWGATFVTAALPGERAAATLQFGVISLAVLLLVRRVVGDRERRALLAERERDVTAREAVVEERARIARELHDAIAHDVSMIVLQAGAERRVLDGGEGTRQVLATIERSGRGALTEMRRLVGLLRSDAPGALAPQPGLEDLPRLVAGVRAAGLPVDLHVEGERRPLAVGIELSAYRIVQEALTNALKHAGDAHATVRVRYDAAALALEIADDGAGAGAEADAGAGAGPREPAASGGHGLVGMHERVTLLGGRLDAARRPSGGFTVRVVLPTR